MDDDGPGFGFVVPAEWADDGPAAYPAAPKRLVNFAPGGKKKKSNKPMSEQALQQLLERPMRLLVQEAAASVPQPAADGEEHEAKPKAKRKAAETVVLSPGGPASQAAGDAAAPDAAKPAKKAKPAPAAPPPKPAPAKELKVAAAPAAEAGTSVPAAETSGRQLNPDGTRRAGKRAAAADGGLVPEQAKSYGPKSSAAQRDAADGGANMAAKPGQGVNGKPSSRAAAPVTNPASGPAVKQAMAPAQREREQAGKGAQQPVPSSKGQGEAPRQVSAKQPVPAAGAASEPARPQPAAPGRDAAGTADTGHKQKGGKQRQPDDAGEAAAASLPAITPEAASGPKQKGKKRQAEGDAARAAPAPVPAVAPAAGTGRKQKGKKRPADDADAGTAPAPMPAVAPLPVQQQQQQKRPKEGPRPTEPQLPAALPKQQPEGKPGQGPAGGKGVGGKATAVASQPQPNAPPAAAAAGAAIPGGPSGRPAAPKNGTGKQQPPSGLPATRQPKPAAAAPRAQVPVAGAAVPAADALPPSSATRPAAAATPAAVGPRAEAPAPVAKPPGGSQLGVPSGATAAARAAAGAGGGSTFLGKMRERLAGGRFRHLNEELYTRSGSDAFKMMKRQPELFQQYHDGFQQQTKGWPKQPVDVAIAWLAGLPKDLVVADFGCGDARLAASVQQRVHSFDLVATAPGVVACNMSAVPLPPASVDVAVFSLALMGTDYGSFLQEAARVLKPKGLLWIAEVRSRFASGPDGGGDGEGGGGGKEDFGPFLKCLAKLGMQVRKEDARNKMFVVWQLRKAAGSGHVPPKSLAWPPLKACVYKKR